MAIATVTTLMAQAGLGTAAELAGWLAEYRAMVSAPRIEEEGGGSTPLPKWLQFVSQKVMVEEKGLLKKIATTLGWNYLDRVRLPESDRETLAHLLSSRVAFQYTVIPLKLTHEHLEVATCDPFDVQAQAAVRFDVRRCLEQAPQRVREVLQEEDANGVPGSLDRPVVFVLAPREEISDALKECYGVGAETLDEIAKDETDEPADGQGVGAEDEEASVIRFVNQVIWEAFNTRATDIHFEPMEEKLRIRYRVDGMLQEAPMPPQLKQHQAAIISRIKVMSGMNIAEKRLPQDGRINIRKGKHELDIRVSTVPTVYGESVSLRLLTRGNVLLENKAKEGPKPDPFIALGFSEDQKAAINGIILKPHGIFLVTGPTGSGKSTSLYAFLGKINSPNKRIITVEEPVEYEMAGINQIAVRPDIGLTFAMGLRHILRQDPNVIMVGEIRDLETAEIAIRAALTGHLVFSTLHTNDAPSAFTRLIDMGIEPFLVASSVEAVMAQRLVRTICTSCRQEQTVDPAYLKRIGFPEEQTASAKFYKGLGCDDCRQFGYQGRTGIYELLVLNDEVRPLILSRAAASAIAERAINGRAKMRTLRMDGWLKAVNGTTTLEEVLRVTQTEEQRTAAAGASD